MNSNLYIFEVCFKDVAFFPSLSVFASNVRGRSPRVINTQKLLRDIFNSLKKCNSIFILTLHSLQAQLKSFQGLLICTGEITNFD